jgi:hypothetical protein
MSGLAGSSGYKTVYVLRPKHRMASPVLSQRTYRLTRIPVESSLDEIRALFPTEERQTIQFASLANSLGSSAGVEKVAAITFARQPLSLQALSFKFGSPLHELLGNIPAKFSAVRVDDNFYGLTPLNDASDEYSSVESVFAPRE